ncbi:hypothetical protein CapIbe_009872 [Capra ibex]
MAAGGAEPLLAETTFPFWLSPGILGSVVRLLSPVQRESKAGRFPRLARQSHPGMPCLPGGQPPLSQVEATLENPVSGLS